MTRSEVTGQWSLFITERIRTYRYHWADRRGRMYLCDCSPTFRTPYGILVPWNLKGMRRSKRKWRRQP